MLQTNAGANGKHAYRSLIPISKVASLVHSCGTVLDLKVYQICRLHATYMLSS